MKLICPECKNEVNLENYPNLAVDQVIECDICGITLLVTKIAESGEVETEIVDEGK
jgi:DNA-directed RNA polymerase subunit RPC12/RpoP